VLRRDGSRFALAAIALLLTPYACAERHDFSPTESQGGGAGDQPDGGVPSEMEQPGPGGAASNAMGGADGGATAMQPAGSSGVDSTGGAPSEDSAGLWDESVWDDGAVWGE
jgi:hypothetical protein